jgi:flagellar biosynthesis protein FliR
MTPDLPPVPTADLVAALAGLVALLQGLAAQGMAVFARVGAAFAVLPAFGERLVPARVRLAGALAMTAIVAPAVETPPLPDSPVALVIYLGGETLAGLALGMALRLIVMALQIAGTIAAQATSLAQFFGGAAADPQPAMAQILMLAGIAALVLAGLPERAAEYLILGYQLLPAGVWADPGAMARWGIGQVAQAFALGFTLAAPFVIGSVLYNLALGAINKAMPQLMVAFVGAPAITLGGLALLAIAAPVMVSVWLGEAARVLQPSFAP